MKSALDLNELAVHMPSESPDLPEARDVGASRKRRLQWWRGNPNFKYADAVMDRRDNWQARINQMPLG